MRKKIVNMTLIIGCLHSVCGYTFELYDSFDRPDTSFIGYTEKVKGGRWVEVDDNNFDKLISIYQNSLRLNCFVGFPNQMEIACNIGGFTSADINIKARCKPNSNNYDNCYGLAYRLPNQISKKGDTSKGYYVCLNQSLSNISLYYGNIVIASVNVDIPAAYTAIQVVADGNSHKIYFNKKLVVDTTHNGSLNAGYVGLWGCNSISFWDDFSVIDIKRKEELSDDFNRPDSDEVGTMKIGGSWKWQRAGKNKDMDLVQIKNQQLEINCSKKNVNSLSANIQDFQAANVDISINAKPDIAYGTSYGMSYRLSSLDNTYGTADGYYVQADQAESKIRLWYNTTKIADVNTIIPNGYSRLRVVALNKSHKVYFQPGSSDNFNRLNSNKLGQIDGFDWYETGDNSTGNLISIVNDAVQFSYFESEPTSPNLTVKIQNYKAKDVDISVKLRPYSDNYGQSYGVCYRCSDANAVFGGSDGYWVKIDKKRNKIYLDYAGTTIAEANSIISDNYSLLRVIATGFLHKIYLNDTLILTVYDSQKTTSGYVGMFGFYSIVCFDDFLVIGRDVNASIDIYDSSKLSEGYVGIFSDNSIVQIDDFKVEIIPFIYPKGNEFPLMLYAIHDIDKERVFGWNIGHIYSSDPNHIAAICNNTSSVYFSSFWDQALTYDRASVIVNDRENDSYLGWWDIPEEMRFWISDEWKIFNIDCIAAKLEDRDQRPRFMYIPGNYGASSVMNYVSMLDIIPASCYVTIYGMPHAWVRWRMEETKEAITGVKYANYMLGSDYLNNEKTLFGIVELFHLAGVGSITPEGAYHDFWQCIVSGAKGVGVYSWAYRNGNSSLKKSWDMYCRAASELTGPEGIDQVILNGKELADPVINYNSGTTKTPEFNPYGGPSKLNQQYYAIDILSKLWEGNEYLFTVSSAEGTCNATLKDIVTFDNNATVLYEERSVPIIRNEHSDAFNRSDSNKLTEVDGNSWLETGDNSRDNLISIIDNKVQFSYFESEPSSPNLSSKIENYYGIDVDISVKVCPYSNNYGRYYGVCYRCSDINAVFGGSDGYWVRLDKENNKVYLRYGNSTIEEAYVTIQENSILRVTTIGSSHKIYVDDNLVLNVKDATRLKGGYVGIWAYYSIVYFDDFTVKDIRGTITDDWPALGVHIYKFAAHASE